MTTSTWFDDLPVLGQLPPAPAAANLRVWGESAAASPIRLPPPYGQLFLAINQLHRIHILDHNVP